MSLKRIIPDIPHLLRNFDSLLPRIPSSFLSPTLASSKSEESSLYNIPFTDIQETDDAYLIETDMPGVPKENITMDLGDDNTLNIKGHIDTISSKGGKHSSYWAKERVVGDFRRSFSLPFKVEPDKIKASLKNGVLKVEIPKTERPESRIPISISEEKEEHQKLPQEAS